MVKILPQNRACRAAVVSYRSRMAATSTYLAEEALALPPAQRAELAKLLTDSLADDGRSDDEIRAMLRARLDALKSGKDAGLSFEEVFGEPA